MSEYPIKWGKPETLAGNGGEGQKSGVQGEPARTPTAEPAAYPGLQYAGTAYGCRVHVGAHEAFADEAWWGRTACDWSGPGSHHGRDLVSLACAHHGGTAHVTPEVLAALDTWVPWSERVATTYDEKRRSLSESAHVEDRFNAEPVAYACTRCNDTGQRPAGLLGWHGARECDCEAAQPSEPLPILTVEGGRARLHLGELSEDRASRLKQWCRARSVDWPDDAYNAECDVDESRPAGRLLAAVCYAHHADTEGWPLPPHLRAIEDAHRALEVAQCRAAKEGHFEGHEKAAALGVVKTKEGFAKLSEIALKLAVCIDDDATSAREKLVQAMRPTDSRHLAHTPPEERLPAQEKLSAQETDGDQ